MKPAKIMQVRTLAVNRICYSNLEQLCIACRKYTLTEDDVSALTSGEGLLMPTYQYTILMRNTSMFSFRIQHDYFFYVDLHVANSMDFDYYEKIK